MVSRIRPKVGAISMAERPKFTFLYARRHVTPEVFPEALPQHASVNSLSANISFCWKGEIDSPEAGRWTLMGPQCIWMDDENAWVGLTGQPPDCPALWNKGEMTTLLMNGYLTGVVYE